MDEFEHTKTDKENWYDMNNGIIRSDIWKRMKKSAEWIHDSWSNVN